MCFLLLSMKACASEWNVNKLVLAGVEVQLTKLLSWTDVHKLMSSGLPRETN